MTRENKGALDLQNEGVLRQWITGVVKRMSTQEPSSPRREFSDALETVLREPRNRKLVVLLQVGEVIKSISKGG